MVTDKAHICKDAVQPIWTVLACWKWIHLKHSMHVNHVGAARKAMDTVRQSAVMKMKTGSTVTPDKDCNI